MPRVPFEVSGAILRHHAPLVRIGDTQTGESPNVPAGVLAQQRDTD